jgi:phosphonate degradation associated HDIG domain protein
MQAVIDKIVSTFDARGGEKYADEEVTQLQHALQCANLAQQENASETLIAAALLHDIGHILQPSELPPHCDMDLHDHHEEVGYQFLKDQFGDAVADPVRLHVAAKRYLCTTQAKYRDKLSPTSLKSFYDQGGEMDASEIAEFEQEPFFDDAVRLRRWDDLAKDSQLPNQDVRDFIPQIEAALFSNAN